MYPLAAAGVHPQLSQAVSPAPFLSCADGKSMDYAEVAHTFARLADTHFVQRCPAAPTPENSDPGPPPPAPTLVVNEKDMYLVPKLSLIGKKFDSRNYYPNRIVFIDC